LAQVAQAKANKMAAKDNGKGENLFKSRRDASYQEAVGAW